MHKDLISIFLVLTISLYSAIGASSTVVAGILCRPSTYMFLGANVRLNTFTPGSDWYYPEAFDQLVMLNCNVVRLTGASKSGWFQLKREFTEEMLENFLIEAGKRGIKTIFLLSDMRAHLKPLYSQDEVDQIKR